MQREIQALHPGQQIAIPADAYQRACGAEADVRALYERVSHLWILQEAGVLASWQRDGGVPDDAVFHVAATIPMSRMQTGVVIKNRHLMLGNLSSESSSGFRVNAVAETDRLPDNFFALTPAILERTP